MRFVLIMCVCLGIVMGLCSCKKSDAPVAPAEPEPVIKANVPVDSSLVPVNISAGNKVASDVSIRYPVLQSSGHDTEINRQISERIDSYLASYASMTKTVDFKIMYNNKGILSILMYAYGETITDVTKYIPLNFNIAGASEIVLEDMFDTSKADWDKTLVYYVNTLASRDGIALYNEITSAEGADFYLTQENLVLIYELYEIAPFSINEPAFAIPYNALSDDITKNGAIAYILGE